MNDQQFLGSGMMLLIAVIIVANRRRTGGRSSDLDRAVFRWTKRDVFSVRDLLNGGLLILGITGGGKSSSSGKQIARALVRDRNSFGLIMAAKPEDLPMWKNIFAEKGQSRRLLVFDADKSPLRFDFLGEAGRYGGDSREITKCITTIGESLQNGDRGKGGENAAFFLAQQERLIHHAVEILKVGRGTVNASDLHQFISTAAQSGQQLADPTWRQCFHSKCIEAAFLAKKSKQGAHDLQQAVDYYCQEFPAMADRTRSSILSGVFGTLFVFNSGMVHERVSTTSNFSFEQMRRKRQWLLVNTSPAVYGDSGAFIGAGFKYLMQRFVLRTEARPSDPINVIWCDEAQNWTNQFDAEYIAQCRSHRGCMVFLTQSLQSFHTSMNSESANRQTLSLLGNFGNRIFHGLGDTETAEWASKTLGHRLETHIGGSTQPAESIFDQLMGYTQSTSSFSTQYEPVLQPGVFMNGLRSGGPANRYLCDAIVVRPGMPFSNGENWLQVTFSQR